MAHNPSPTNGANGISVYSVDLAWTPGSSAAGHRILLGTSPASLQILESNYPSASYTLTALDYETEYFWRIDELYSSGPDVTGQVWSFTTMNAVGPCFDGDLNGDCKVDIMDLFLRTLSRTLFAGTDMPGLLQALLLMRIKSFRFLPLTALPFLYTAWYSDLFFSLRREHALLLPAPSPYDGPTAGCAHYLSETMQPLLLEVALSRYAFFHPVKPLLNPVRSIQA